MTANTRTATSWRRIWLIARREMLERTRQRAYRIALVAGALLVAAGVVVPTLIDSGDGDAKAPRVLVAFPGQSEAQAKVRADQLVAASQVGAGIATLRPTLVSEAQARARVRDGDEDQALVIRGTAEQPQLTILAREGALSDGSAATEVVQRAALRARLARVAPAERDQLLAPITARQRVVAGTGSDGTTAAVLSAMSFVLYLGGLLLVSAFATGLISDRAGRVTERLITAARPAEHLAGKLLGVGAAGGLQLLVWLVAGGAAAVAVAGSLSDTFGGVPIELVVFFPIALVLTYLVFAALATLLLIPVRKTEDVGSALLLATMLQIVAFIAASSIFAPGSTVSGTVQALSLVPFFSPLLMLARIGQGDVAAWEIAVAVIGPILTTALLLRLAAPAYARHAVDAPGGKGLGAVLAALRG